MPGSASELLFYGLIIAGFLLFNYVTQQLAKKARQEQEEAAAPPEDGPPEDIWGRAPAAAPATPEPVAPAVPVRRAEVPAQPRRRMTSGILFRTRKDLRHAVVLMTVLGPCRALRPDD